mgnify:CR=1 FL=1|jgi:small neutral amino acid transporter SnatA (MarC family)
MKLFVLFLIILNPFSQALYLRELFEQLRFREFASVHFRATVYSFLILGTFAIIGEPILQYVFQVRLGSLQVFGGLVNLWVAYRFITAGEGSTLLFRGDVAELAPNITLPYMVGAGGLWISILMGRQYDILVACLMIAGVLLINLLFVLFCHRVFSATGSQLSTALTKGLAMLMRVMALFIGAIGVEMIFSGAETLI